MGIGQAKFNCLILLQYYKVLRVQSMGVANLFFQSRLPIYSQMPHFQNIINVMNSELLAAASKLTNISYRLEKDY